MEFQRGGTDWARQLVQWAFERLSSEAAKLVVWTPEAASRRMEMVHC